MKKSYPLKKIIFGIAVLGLVLASSCKNENSPAQPATNTAETSNQGNEETVQVNPAHGQPGHTCALPVGAPLNTGNSTQQSNNAKTPEVNPAHGMPGHTCALPVGAPLSSSNTMQQSTSNTTTQSSTISPIRVDQTPKINPPHGEPGHTCSLPVGAELE